MTGIAIWIFLGGVTTIASGLAMTIAFGIAIDDTVHFINRARLERREGRNAAEAVRNAVAGVGFVLCATTLVIGLGVSLTWASEFLTVRAFGGLMVMILVFALLGDLMILPAVMLIWRRWR
jgi:predicted RND superfamily exporter protein